MQEVKAICKRVIIINNGQLAADSTENDLVLEVDKDRFSTLVEFAGEITPEKLRSLQFVLQVEPIGTNTFHVKS